MDARRATAEELLSSIVSAHGRQLTRFFLSRVPEPSEAQDLVQEVYLRVLKLERPELIRSPRAYLYRIAANIAREHWVRRAARPPHVGLDEVAVGECLVGEDQGVALEHRDQLAALLSDLPAKVRAALIWAHRDGHTYEEISVRLAVPKNRVKKYLARALAHCRKGALAEAFAAG